MHSQKYYSHNYTALLNSCCKENREHSFLGQSLTVAWNMYLLHLVFKFLSFWDRCVSFNNLACCDFSAPCIMPLHVMFCFLSSEIGPISFYDQCFGLIYRYWRVFLNYQKIENVQTAKASTYPVTILILLFYELETTWVCIVKTSPMFGWREMGGEERRGEENGRWLKSTKFLVIFSSPLPSKHTLEESWQCWVFFQSAWISINQRVE